MASEETPIARRYARAVIRRLSDPIAYLPMPPRPPTASPRVGVVGYYGWGNYGDELFLEVFREHLGPPLTLHSVLDPRAGRVLRRAIGGAVRRSDVILIGGGDLVVPWAPYNRYWDRAYAQRPVFIAGVGVATWREPTPAGMTVLRRFFGHPSVRLIGVRDGESASWIREQLGVTAPIRVHPDLAFAASLPPVTRQADPPIFGIAVRDRASLDDFSHVRRLGLRAQMLGYRVRRIVLATGATRVRDMNAAERLGLPHTELVASDDLMTISRAIGECTAMASMKFHGVVVATMYGVPCLVLMPTAKNRYLVNAIGRPDLLSVFSDAELEDRLTADPEPIDPSVRDRLCGDARAFLKDLREKILATAADAA